MESVQDWAKRERENTREPEQLQSIEALALLLEGKTSPLATAKTVTAICESAVADYQDPNPYKYELYEDQPDFRAHQLWRLICGAISTFGSAESRDRLISLLVEISRQPDIIGKEGGQITHYLGDVYWSGLAG